MRLFLAGLSLGVVIGGIIIPFVAALVSDLREAAKPALRMHQERRQMMAKE